MAMIAEACNAEIIDGDSLGWRGDAIEAEGFAYMALRNRLGLAISFPTSTGAHAALGGGHLVRADDDTGKT